ncbi:hypothetical protein BKA70DRAFT_1421367 [Coprinopsis sp. MPI-PUGE-AT-0042]|nr:hypothetical protein BKA70DRAFT_1421367 [Coprinopsis sp. MPI-PUGE-AT-0042]
MAANSFDRALHLITSIKLQEVEKQRLAYGELSKVLDAPSSQPQTPINRVSSLVTVIRSWTSSGSIEKTTEIAGSLTLENLDYWILEAKTDPNFSQDIRCRMGTLLFRFTSCEKLPGLLLSKT